MRAHHLGLLSFPVLLVSAIACGGGGGTGPGGTTPAGVPSLAGSNAAPVLPDHPDSDKVTWKKDPSPKSCHTGDKGAGDLVAGVTAMANACVVGLKQVGQPQTGEGSQSNMVKSIPFHAQAKHCYRFFGLAQASVTDLDIAVMDSAGKSTGEDLGDSNDAVVLENGAVCFNADDDVNVNVAVASGSGKWAMEIWSD